MCDGIFVGGSHVELKGVDFSFNKWEILVLGGFYVVLRDEEEGIAEFEDSEALEAYFVSYYGNKKIPSELKKIIEQCHEKWNKGSNG